MLDIYVQDPYFTHLSTGLKTREGRVASLKYTACKPGDEIRFLFSSSEANDSTPPFYATVVAVTTYPSFAAMMAPENGGWRRAIPDAVSIEEAVAVYHSFPGYAEAESLHGVVALDVDVSNK